MAKGKGKWMDQKALKKYENETCQMVLILSAAYLMDEMDYSEDRIIEYWDSVVRYVDAIKEHTITLDRVCEIINEHTGLSLRRKK